MEAHIKIKRNRSSFLFEGWWVIFICKSICLFCKGIFNARGSLTVKTTSRVQKGHACYSIMYLMLLLEITFSKEFKVLYSNTCCCFCLTSLCLSCNFSRHCGQRYTCISFVHKNLTHTIHYTVSKLFKGQYVTCFCFFYQTNR